jgi:hypothetical protein
MLLLAATLAALSTAPPLRADQPAGDAKNEIVVFGGISLLDASRTSTATIGGDRIDMSAMRGFGRFGIAPGSMPFPIPPFEIPPITIEAETSLGSSALFGARYSRLVKPRLAVEADLQVAPSHSLEIGGRGCVAGICIDPASMGRGGGGGEGRPGFARLGDRNVTAWHYGAGLAYEITGGDVRPFLTLGAGGVTWDGARESDTSFVLRFGAGLKVLFGRVGARVDVVDHFVLDHFASGQNEHDVHVTAGLLVRF